MDALVTRLADAGFDVAHAFDAHAASVPGWEHLSRGPRVGLLVGNTRALWPRFVTAMEDEALQRESDPLDRYTERVIAEAAEHRLVVFAHQRYDGAYLPFQHLAVAVGLGALAASHLVIHPVHGPWFALRAVVTFDGEPPVTAPIAKPCACGEECPRALAAALRDGGWQRWCGVREACSLRAGRYSDDQIAYHYTKLWKR